MYGSVVHHLGENKKQRENEMLSNKQRMTKAIKGEYADQIPWIPRFDLWYNAHRYRNTLPDEFKGLTLGQIADTIGVGQHRVIPEFMDYRDPSDIVDRALGIFNLPPYPFRTELRNIDREVRVEGNYTFVTYHTPKGSVSAKIRYDEEMREAGVSISWIEEHVIKCPEDYAVVGYIFKNLKLTPDYEDYKKYEESIGQNGFAVAVVHLAAGPYQAIMRDFMPMSDFYMELLYDHPTEIRQLADDMTPYFYDIFRLTSESPAMVFLFGGNYDEVITYPPLYEEYFLPWLQKFSEILHENGKFLLSHCDGENQGLMDLILDSGIDIAEAIAPAPMTKLTIGEYYQKWGKGERMTMFGGVPSTILMETVSDEEFEVFMKNLFREIAPGKRFILGISDTTPPDAKFERIYRISEMCGQWGKLPL